MWGDECAVCVCKCMCAHVFVCTCVHVHEHMYMCPRVCVPVWQVFRGQKSHVDPPLGRPE